MPLKLISINCRGLKNKNIKRWQIFNICKKYDIACLQETHITHDLVCKWKKEWTGELKYVAGSNRSKGQVILINKYFKYSEIEDIHLSERILGINVTTEDGTYPILNVYGPNESKERETFFKNILEVAYGIEDISQLVICGDFNTVLDNKLDIVCGNEHKPRDILQFQRLLKTADLCDVWRAFNENTKDFTWSRANPYIARRLDYILISKHNISNVSDIKHIPIPDTDHKGVAIELKRSTFKRGPNIWKCNTSLVKDQEYLNGVVGEIITFLENNNGRDPEIKFELLKVEIKNYTIKYSTQKNKSRKNKESELGSEIEKISNDLIKQPQSEELNRKLVKTKQELSIIQTHTARGAQIRSRIQWTQEGEKNTKYFLGLEKAKGNANTIEQLKTQDKTLTNPLEILGEIKSYYKDLYTKDSTITNTEEKLKDFLTNIDHPVLTEEEKNYCDTDITIEQLGYALSKLNNDSAPGSDGLSVPLYKVLWKYLKQPLFESIKASLSKGSLSTTQRRGIITLFHKGSELDKNNLSNWRPITLTNTDYKIFSKLLSLRIKEVIASIIHESQKGYIKGRSISDTIRIIDDFLNISNHAKTPGLLVSIDFRKAFDSIEKQGILSTLKKFNFGNTFISYIDVLLKDTQGCVRNGGWHSGWFETQRGVKQGCCLSPYLFLLVAELMSIKIRKEAKVKSINLHPFKDILKILLFADDTTLFLEDEKSLKEAFKIIEELGKFTGLKLNRKKSIVLPVGGYKKQDQTNNEAKWLRPHEHIKLLGIYFNAHIEASRIEQNWMTKIEIIQRMIKQWQKRNISLYGKVIIAKTFLLSQFTYLIQSLRIPDHVLNTIDKIIFGFLWQTQDTTKKVMEKVKRNVLCQDKYEGGLGMISIKDQQQACLLKWIKKACERRENSTIFPQIADHYLSTVGNLDYITKCKIQHKEMPKMKNTPSIFWEQLCRDVLEQNIQQIQEEDLNVEEILSQPLFMNTYIRYKNKTLFIEKWIRNKVLYVHDIFTHNGFVNIEEISQKTNSSVALEMLNWNIVVNAIPKKWKNKLQNIQHSIWAQAKENSETLPDNVLMMANAPNKIVRQCIVRGKKAEACGISHWNRILGIDVSPYLMIAEMSTKESRLRLLQYKIIHNIVATNVNLNRWKIKQNDKCTTCEELDTIQHMFSHCRNLNGFWDYVSSRIYGETNKKIKLTTNNIILGILESELQNCQKDLNLINHIILIAKYSINKMRFGEIKNIFIIFDMEISYRLHQRHYDIEPD